MARTTKTSSTSKTSPKPEPETIPEPEAPAPETASASIETTTAETIPETIPESPSPSQSPSESPSAAASSDGFSGDHLALIDAGEMPDPDDDARTFEYVDEASGKTLELYTMKGFRAAFIGFFDGASVLPEMFDGDPLKSLAIKASEKARAEAAADALYRKVIRNRLLRHVLRPGSQEGRDWIALLLFVGPKAKAVAEEMRIRAYVHEHQMQQREAAAVAEYETAPPAEGDAAAA